jgi:carboxylesterase type B
VLSTFSISTDLSPSKRLDKLRSIPATTLVSRIFDFDTHTFRGVTDNDMISSDLIASIYSGNFASRFKERGMRILLGEAETEEVLYSLTNPPPDFSDDEMLKALNNYYAGPVCEALLSLYKNEGGAADARVVAALALSNEQEKARQLFGLITSDVQVRAPIRVLSKALFDGGVPAERVLRYRVAYRPDCTDKVYPRSFGVTHAADGVSWWYVERYGFSEAEKQSVKKWLGKTLIPLVAGGGNREEKLGAEEFFYFKKSGEIDVVKDQHWEWLSRVAKTLR